MSSAATQLLSLGRYLVLARLLGPEQLGLAAVLMLTLQFFELATDTGSDKFLIQTKNGDEPKTQAAMQLIRLWRGLLSAAAMAAAAWPLSVFFGEPRLFLPLAILGLNPLIMGAVHLDMRRVQRQKRFAPEARALIVADVAGFVATAAAAFVVRDFTAVLYGAVARPFALVAMSHLQADRGYELSFAAHIRDDFLRFSTPLIVNGLFLFLGNQGDRLVVTQTAGLTAFGHYVALVLLITSPCQAAARYLSITFVPAVAAARHEPGRFLEVSSVVGRTCVALFTASMAGFALVAPLAVPILYGPDFVNTVLLCALVGIHQSLRFVRIWPSSVAMGAGATRTIMTSNVARLAALPLAFAGWALTKTMEGVVAGFIVGELIALGVALLSMARAAGTDFREDAFTLAHFAGTAAAVAACAWATSQGNAPLAVGAAALALSGLAIVALRERERLQGALFVIRRTLRR